MKRITGIIALLNMCLCVGLLGQADEKVAFDRPEGWAMRYFAGASLMLADGPPPGLQPGKFALGFEMVELPHLSEAERTVGFNGTKEENLNKAPLLARPLVHYGIADRWSLTVSYVPPIEVFDRLRTHLGGVSLNHTLYERGAVRAGLRLIGQWTQARGDFTCPADVAGVMDPAINPYGCAEPSEDTFTSWTSSLEASLVYRLPTARPWRLFGSAAYTYADLDFQIDAHYFGGAHDNRHLYTHGWMWAFAAGTQVDLGEDWSLTFALAHVPLDIRRPPDFDEVSESLTHFRLTLNYRL